MRQIKLDGDNDLDLTRGKLNIVEDDEAIAQKLRVGLRIFLGEFFADLEVGVPYYEKILVKNPQLGLIQQVFKKAILSCEGVTGVESMTAQFFSDTRKLVITFFARMQSGRLVPVKDSFIIGLKV